MIRVSPATLSRTPRAWESPGPISEGTIPISREEGSSRFGTAAACPCQRLRSAGNEDHGSRVPFGVGVSVGALCHPERGRDRGDGGQDWFHLSRGRTLSQRPVVSEQSPGLW